MTSEELLEKYPTGVVLSAEDKLNVYNKLKDNAQLTEEEAEKLHDAIEFLEANSFTLNHAVLILKRRLALLRLQLKFSLELIPVSEKDNDSVFLAEMQHLDAIINLELEALQNGNRKQNSEADGATTEKGEAQEAEDRNKEASEGSETTSGISGEAEA